MDHLLTRSVVYGRMRLHPDYAGSLDWFPINGHLLELRFVLFDDGTYLRLST